MSEDSFHSEHPGGWIEWFCSHEDHLFLCEIDEEFVKDPSNSYDFKHNYSFFEYSKLNISKGMPSNLSSNQKCQTQLNYKTHNF